MRLARALLLLCVGVAGLQPEPARACSCVGQREPGRLIPSPGATLPTNGRIVLTDGGAWPNGAPISVGNGIPAPHLRRVARVGGAPRKVTSTIAAFATWQWGYYLVVPSAPLAPGERYELVAIDPRDGKEGVVASYTTAAGPDDAAPTWPGSSRAKAYFEPPPYGGECTYSSASLEIEGSVPTDTGGPSSDVFIALWTAARAEGPIDYSKPPAAVIPAEARISLDRPHKCSSTSKFFCFGCERIGMRALDVAGNASPPREIVVGRPFRRVR